MDRHKQLSIRRMRRRGHVRRAVRGNAQRPRLTVFRSLKHITAQVIDDSTGRTLAAASTQQSEVREGLPSTGNLAAAKQVGKVIAERAKAAGVEKVCFDRGHYKYHGLVAALATAAREGGLNF